MAAFVMSRWNRYSSISLNAYSTNFKELRIMPLVLYSVCEKQAMLHLRELHWLPVPAPLITRWLHCATLVPSYLFQLLTPYHLSWYLWTDCTSLFVPHITEEKFGKRSFSSPTVENSAPVSSNCIYYVRSLQIQPQIPISLRNKRTVLFFPQLFTFIQSLCSPLPC